ncbi:MAG: FGGY family carbohydrate kinase [Caldilineales bacterium]
MDIWNSQLNVAKQALNQAGVSPDEVAAIGITNQRETTIVWEKATGKPIMNGIVWQDRRTANICDDMKARGLTDVRRTPAWLLTPICSGTKIKWMLDTIPGARQRAEPGELLFGTVDTWLIWNLTGGKVHVTDYSTPRAPCCSTSRRRLGRADVEELTIPRAMLPSCDRPATSMA